MSERRRTWIVRALIAGVVLLLLWLPLYAGGFFLQTGLFAMAAAIAAIGLTLLVGITGQLSLAHAFFIAVGAYGYCYLAAEPPDPALAASQPSGLGLPPVVAMIGASLLAGVAGALFSPIAGRLRGIYLGLASIGLVFIGQHILFNASKITGGFNGRNAEPFSVFGFSFSNSDPTDFVVFGVPYGQLERLWYLGLVLLAARLVVRPQPRRQPAGPGDADRARLRDGRGGDGRQRAGLQGRRVHRLLDVRRPGRRVPGAVLRAHRPRVLRLPRLDRLPRDDRHRRAGLDRRRRRRRRSSSPPCRCSSTSTPSSLPLVDDPGGSGLQSGDAARFLYGAAVVAVLIFARGGLAGLARRAIAETPATTEGEHRMSRTPGPSPPGSQPRCCWPCLSPGCGTKGESSLVVGRRLGRRQDRPGRHRRRDHARLAHRPVRRVRPAGQADRPGQAAVLEAGGRQGLRPHGQAHHQGPRLRPAEGRRPVPRPAGQGRRAPAAARLADHRRPAADAGVGLDALAARRVAVVAAVQRLRHRDRRVVRHRDDQRPLQAARGGQDRQGRQDRPRLLRGRVRRERPQGRQGVRRRERHDHRRAEDQGHRRGHVGPGRRAQARRRQGDRA